MAGEIKELQLITHRINEMYIYLGNRFKNIMKANEKEKEDITNEVAKEKQTYEQGLEKYNNDIRLFKEEAIKLQKELEGSKEVNTKLQAKIDEISEHNENYKELNKQYKSSIEKLKVTIEDLEHLRTENNRLVIDNKQLQENNDNLASELWFCKREVEKIEEKFLKDKEDHRGYVSRIKEQHTLERQTSILELQLKHQKTIESLNVKTANLQTDYNNKLKELLFNIEKQKKDV